MADNYIDIPMMVLKLRSNGAITTGAQLQVDSLGYVDASDTLNSCGMVAMEPTTDSAQYFDAMIIGTAYFAMAETTKAGKAVGYSAAGVMTGTLTKARHSVATILDGVDSVLHPFGTRMHRVFFWGQYGVNIANTESLWAGD